MDQCSPSPFLRLLKRSEPEPELALTDLERSTVPDAPMSLFMRIQTLNGPRTVIASGVTVATASRISEVLALSGHYAEVVDQSVTKETVPQRIRRKKLEKLPKLHAFDRTARRVANS